MPQLTNMQQAASQIADRIVTEWSAQLKSLLETKHLYQKVEVNIPQIRASMRESINAGILVHIDQAIDVWENRPLEALMTRTTENISVGNAITQVLKPTLLVTNIKLFCTHCGDSEVFYPVWARDVTSECHDPRGNVMPRLNQFQLFFLALQCQNCHRDPEGVLVRRDGYRLYLEGRSPIEHVDLSKYIPKKEAHFFSDAVVAYNAGKKLAGLFYLRTFLEQYAKRITGIDGRATGEELMEAYTATLPLAHRDHMPSFREWYEKLSEALHDAREDDVLFENAKSEIDRHFDIRRVFKIPEVEPNATANEAILDK